MAPVTSLTTLEQSLLLVLPGHHLLSGCMLATDEVAHPHHYFYNVLRPQEDDVPKSQHNPSMRKRLTHSPSFLARLRRSAAGHAHCHQLLSIDILSDNPRRRKCITHPASFLI